MGFGHFLSIPLFQIEMGLRESVTECYHHHTSSIVTRVGEFVLSLEDMVRLTELGVAGHPVTSSVHSDYTFMMAELVGWRIVMYGPRLFLTSSAVHRVDDSRETATEPGVSVVGSTPAW